MENDEYLISINDSDQENVELIRPNIFKSIKRYLNGSTEFQRKLSNQIFFNKKINAVWLIALIFFSNILLFGLIVNLNESKIIVIIAILLNLIYAVTLSLFKQTKIRDLDSFQVCIHFITKIYFYIYKIFCVKGTFGSICTNFSYNCK
jgi:hypothetical protein